MFLPPTKSIFDNISHVAYHYYRYYGFHAAPCFTIFQFIEPHFYFAAAFLSLQAPHGKFILVSLQSKELYY